MAVSKSYINEFVFWNLNLSIQPLAALGTSSIFYPWPAYLLFQQQPQDLSMYFVPSFKNTISVFP